MRNISLVLSSVVIFSSCSSDNRPITLVCDGILRIESQNFVPRKFYPTEEYKVSRTYKFIYEERDVEKLNKTERKKVWVFDSGDASESRRIIYEKNKETLVHSKELTIENTTLDNVIVRKDDISVSHSFFKKVNTTRLIQKIEFTLTVDRVSGKFTEIFVNNDGTGLVTESMTGTCVKVEKNKI